jgi:hypothetical protein
MIMEDDYSALTRDQIDKVMIWSVEFYFVRFKTSALEIVIVITNYLVSLSTIWLIKLEVRIQDWKDLFVRGVISIQQTLSIVQHTTVENASEYDDRGVLYTLRFVLCNFCHERAKRKVVEKALKAKNEEVVWILVLSIIILGTCRCSTRPNQS